MYILSRPISNRTERLVNAIYRSLRFPVEYAPIIKRPNVQDQVAGTVDPHGRNDVYPVWLNESLPQSAFEVDLLHELHHISQIEAGFSEVFKKETPALRSLDGAFIVEVGSHLSSIILDMEVNHWLLLNGYSYEFFTKRNFETLLATAGHPYTRLDDPLNFANLSCALLHGSLYVDDASAKCLFEAYSSYPELTKMVAVLRKKLLAMKIDNSVSTLLAHGLLLDSMGLWKFYYAATPARRVRTHGEYAGLIQKMGCLSDMAE